MRVGTVQVGYGQRRCAWAVPIAAELDAVESKLLETIRSDVPAAAECAGRLLAAGGKRIRPALVILSALAADAAADRDAVVDLAAAAELVHSASLMHDDVVDGTRERRGTATISAQYGNKISVLGGDFLLGKAFSLLAAHEDSEIIRLLADTAIKMSESEILQAAAEDDFDMWNENYWRIIRDKTAAFTSSCCECGAIIAGASAEVRGALRGYGIDLGIAFQVIDDVLDVVGDPAVTGKDAGADLAHGKFTLPVILALRSMEQSSRRTILGKLKGNTTAEPVTADIIRLVVESGAVDLSRKAAVSHADRAVAHLEQVPESTFTQALADLATFVVTRRT